jgi:quercetin dioxygenase-like cupin family protein
MKILRASAADRAAADWGELTFFASGKLGNSDEVTVGRCVIRPGKSNPRHSHPNTEEVLTVIAGTILHSTEDGDVRLETGDTITIPVGLPHRALNVGRTDAELWVVFPTPDRQVQGE